MSAMVTTTERGLGCRHQRERAALLATLIPASPAHGADTRCAAPCGALSTAAGSWIWFWRILRERAVA
jgi:hypothetical protein